MLYCVHLEIIKPNYFCEFRNYIIIIFINNVTNSNLSTHINLKISISIHSRPTSPTRPSRLPNYNLSPTDGYRVTTEIESKWLSVADMVG